MWRTGTSRALMDPETAWKRMKIMEKELDKLINEKVKPCYREGITHDELCKEFIQKVFEGQTGQSGKQCPDNWEHAHNNVILTFRIYYDGLQLDPTLPAPSPVVEINVPHEKPAPINGAAVMRDPGTVRYTAASARAPPARSAPVPAPPAAAPPVYAASLEENHEERLQVLREIKEYMQVLEQFDGVIHEDFLMKRKRELFEALPSIPKSCTERSLKRQRQH
ncbi:MAG: hypothetical protein SGBAC_003221 [Bacillariaceae sp.]